MAKSPHLKPCPDARVTLLEHKFRISGVAVLDIVEGSAMEVLPHMHNLLNARPDGFDSPEAAIEWQCTRFLPALDTKTIRNANSAHLSIPAIIVPAATPFPDRATYQWRTPLRSTVPYWPMPSSQRALHASSCSPSTAALCENGPCANLLALMPGLCAKLLVLPIQPLFTNISVTINWCRLIGPLNSIYTSIFLPVLPWSPNSWFLASEVHIGRISRDVLVWPRYLKVLLLGESVMSCYIVYSGKRVFLMGKTLKHGAAKLVPVKHGEKNRIQSALKTTTASRALNFRKYDAESLCNKCRSVVSESLDECFAGSWVFVKSDMPEGGVKTGRVSEMWSSYTGTVIVILELFQVLSTRDETFGMPVLVRRDGETTFLIIPAKNLMFKFNAQHSCHTAECAATRERLRMQERVESDNTEKYIEHNPVDRFIINSHAFHNAHLLRAALPRALLAPIPLFEDRQSKHHELAAELREKQESRRAKRKRPATDHDTDDETQAAVFKKPRKRQKRKPKRKKQGTGPVITGLVQGRPKRIITRTKRALAADEEQGDEDSELDPDDSELLTASGQFAHGYADAEYAAALRLLGLGFILGVGVKAVLRLLGFGIVVRIGLDSFPCLRRFKQGRRFKQWTGDDSKALMKVYLPAIKGLVPPTIVEAISTFLDFCYLVRRADFEESTLDAVDAAVKKYHVHREIFRELDVRPDRFSLPRQHSMTHYRVNIEDFGAPGGVCSSITESCHITAVKKPWRRSSRYEALSQMLLTNQRLDKLAAARSDFVERGMVPPNFIAVPDKEIEDEEAEAIDEPRVEGNVVLARRRERSYPRFAEDLADHIKVPAFPDLLASFLEDQLQSDKYSDDASDGFDISEYPISVYHSAIATFYAPSDPSGIRGMRRERIRSTPTWRKHGPRRDCAFAVENQQEQGFRGMSVVRVRLFFSFTHDGIDYPCALVE
ncbi:hypothetical protein B0H10DRAFT_2193179 [Mycena sp. CBHHK59/15]|nr:hypothetical protein B0H10DRAFT_2193179 [Mycena sp. CBHHK59/15]